jgi:23S rRNA pseudouridine1911/1915/1917 synthase
VTDQIVTDQFVVQGLPAPQRLDRILRARYPHSGRQAIQQLIGQRQVEVNGRTVWLASWLVANGDVITLHRAPATLPSHPQRFDPTWLIADEGDLLAVNKPAGLLSEPRRGLDRPSLLQLATAHFGPLTLAHRLDRDTSGLVLLTRGGEVNVLLARAFQEGLVHKEYIAVVAAPNRLQQSGVIDVRLRPSQRRRDQMEPTERGGQRAITRYEVIAVAADRAWVRLFPETGRMHQLRVHLAYLGAPILGDRLYGSAHSASRLMLHAHLITLPAQIFGVERRFVAPLPPDFTPNQTPDS